MEIPIPSFQFLSCICSANTSYNTNCSESFCEVLGLIFIVLVRLTLENIQLTLSYKLKNLWSFKGSLFLIVVVGWCHYMPILSEVCTYIYLNCIIILRVFARERIFFPNNNHRSRRILDPTHLEEQCTPCLIILI